ncbi:hypothetical protein ABEW05_007792 [Botrytis cinerea]
MSKSAAVVWCVRISTSATQWPKSVKSNMMKNRSSARKVSLVVRYRQMLFKPKLASGPALYPKCARVGVNQSLDVMKFIGFIKGRSKKVAILTVFGLPGPIAFSYPYATLRQLICRIEIFVLKAVGALMSQTAKRRLPMVHSEACQQGWVKDELPLNLINWHRRFGEQAVRLWLHIVKRLRPAIKSVATMFRVS